MISLLLGFPFTAVKDFIFPYEPQLALRFKIFQPNSFTFFLNLKIIFFPSLMSQLFVTINSIRGVTPDTENEAIVPTWGWRLAFYPLEQQVC